MNLTKLNTILKKNKEFFLLILISLVTLLSIQLFNAYKNQLNKNLFNLLNNIYLEKTLKFTLDNLDPKYINIEHKVSLGETFDKILKIYKIPKEEIIKIKNVLSKKNDLSKLQKNQIIKFTIEKTDTKKIVKFIFPLSKIKEIQLIRNLAKNNFLYNEINKNLKKKILYREGKITNSLYKSAIDLNIKPNLIIEFARIYGFKVDFQRDIRRNDSFQILYETFQDDKGKIYETGNIIYANLTLRGEKNELYYFKEEKNEDHYNGSGKSIKKALMKTPINGAKLSSSYGMRKHPILGFNKMHRGTDFAAPKGTPIMASGDGIIIRAKWCGGGGNCVKIKHNSSYTTVYAHMDKFASGIRVGKRVKQGQIIGFVGSTGLSTGPHLHYVVIENGKKINSQTLKLPSGKILKGKQRKLFEIAKIKINVLKSEMILKQN